MSGFWDAGYDPAYVPEAGFTDAQEWLNAVAVDDMDISVPVNAERGSGARVVQNVLAETVELLQRIEEYLHSPRSIENSNGATTVGLRVSPTMIDAATDEATFIRVVWCECGMRGWLDDTEVATYPRSDNPGTHIRRVERLGKTVTQVIRIPYESPSAPAWDVAARAAFLKSEWLSYGELAGWSRGYRSVPQVSKLARELSFLAERIALDDELMDYIVLWLQTTRERTLSMFREPDQWLTNQEAATLAGVSRSTIKNWKRDGKVQVNGHSKILKSSLTPLLIDL